MLFEVHPFVPFVPKNARYLLIGSFPGQISTRKGDWYYDTKRGQFWPILRAIFGENLASVKEKEELFLNLKIAATDLIYKCKRIRGNNSDSNLTNIVYNKKAINDILCRNNILKIYFSSRYVERSFKKIFKNFSDNYPKIELITLPSSSPRYALIPLKEKIRKFKEVFPSKHVSDI